VADPDTPVLELRGITKRFPGVLANDRVDFDLRRGEVHALLGENGAGKSTLMNILYGLYRPDDGEILLNGAPADFTSPHGAIAAGIGMVHQHFMLIPVMTVAENIVLAAEPRRNGVLLDTAAAERRVRELADQFKFHIDPHAKVQAITVGQQQRVEILKALYRGADILILDEPTAVLTPQEAVELFEILKRLVADGMSVIFISHKLNEVLDVADRITVLRRGEKVDTVPREGATERSLATLIATRRSAACHHAIGADYSILCSACDGPGETRVGVDRSRRENQTLSSGLSRLCRILTAASWRERCRTKGWLTPSSFVALRHWN